MVARRSTRPGGEHFDPTTLGDRSAVTSSGTDAKLQGIDRRSDPTTVACSVQMG
jgi:hypothetical protein